MDLLPKQMCHRCSYKLEEFHKFYMHCIKTDENLKSKLSWMSKDKSDKIIIPTNVMVQFCNVKIKTEPIDVDSSDDPILKPIMSFVDRSSVHRNGFSAFSNEPFCRCCYLGHNCGQRRLQPTSSDVLMDPTQVLVPSVYDNSHLPSQDDIAVISENKKANKIEPRPVVVVSSEKKEPNQPTLAQLGAVKENLLKRFQDSPLKTTDPVDNLKRRTLRPRRNSVDYVLTKKKVSETPRTQSETSRVSEVLPEVLPEVLSVPVETPKKQMKVPSESPLEEKVEPGLRALRPRKTNINYQPSFPSKRKQSTESKQSKKCKHSVLTINIKEENERDDYPEPISVERSKENRQAKEDKLEVIFTKVIDVKVENDVRRDSDKTWNKGNNHKSRNNHSTKSCFSPIRLRSQDIRLRNGKVKEPIDVKVVKEVKIIGDKGQKSVPRARKSDMKIKQFCEKCNVCYEKRHKCSSD